MQHVDALPSGDPRRGSVQHPSIRVACRNKRWRPGSSEVSERRTAAKRASAKLFAERMCGGHTCRPHVLQPDERGAEATTGESFHHAMYDRSLVRRDAVEALAGEKIKIRARDDVGGIGGGCCRKEDLVGDDVGPLDQLVRHRFMVTDTAWDLDNQASASAIALASDTIRPWVSSPVGSNIATTVMPVAGNVNMAPSAV